VVGAPGGEPVEAPPQDLPDALGDGGPVLHRQQAGDLPHEQRVAAGPPVDGEGQVGIRPPAGGERQQLGDVVLAEPAEGDVAGAAGELGQRLGRR